MFAVVQLRFNVICSMRKGSESQSLFALNAERSVSLLPRLENVCPAIQSVRSKRAKRRVQAQ